MVWEAEEIRKVKVIIKRPLKQGQDLIVSFGVAGSQKEAFSKVLLSYFDSIRHEEKGAQITNVEETFDAETGEVCGISIEISGMNQGLFVQEFQQRGQEFIGASTWQF